MSEARATIDLDGLSASLTQAFPRLDAIDQHIAIAVYRVLARGTSATTDAIAGLARVTTGELERRIEAWPAVFRDNEGAIVGFWGLTMNEMPTHAIVVGGVRLWAWCAWDTLFLPGRLGARVHVHSVCPVTNEAIALDVSVDGIEHAPTGVVLSFLNPDHRFNGDVITNFCHYIHFFTSRATGEQWVTAHPGTFLLSLAEGFELALLANRMLGEAIPRAIGPGRRHAQDT